MQPKPSRCIICLLLWWGILGLEQSVSADAQLNLLNTGCSLFNVTTNFRDFSRNLNSTFVELRGRLKLNRAHFATAEGADGVYAMVQCRNYLSTADCLACFDSAVGRIRRCLASNGARVIYDGCSLRYESNNFYNQFTQEGHTMQCGNESASHPTAYASTVKELLAELEVATPRIKGYFVATRKKVVGVSGNASVYGMAQCVGTITPSGCRGCMEVVNIDIQRCSAKTEARAMDVGCFLRYSDSPVFAGNQTMDIMPSMRTGSSSRRTVIIAAVGSVALLLLIIAFLLWFRARLVHFSM